MGARLGLHSQVMDELRRVLIAICLLAIIKFGGHMAYLAQEEIDSAVDAYVRGLGMWTSGQFHLEHVDSEPVATHKPRVEFNYRRCAHLHNKIFELGWKGAHPDTDLSTHKKTTWWHLHQDKAEEIQARLSPSLIEFLKLAIESVEDDDRRPFSSFTYHVGGLNWYNNMWYGLEDTDDEESSLVLYSANEGSHTMGLVFNQDLNLATFMPSIFDHVDGYHDSGMLMYPLESVLEQWLHMIQYGKIAALPQDQEEYEGQPKNEPWVLRPHCENDVITAVRNFYCLVKAIRVRMPRNSKGDHGQSLGPEVSGPVPTSSLPLIDIFTLDSLDITPASFLYEFLSRANKPPASLKYIAPGLTYPTPLTLRSLLDALQVPEGIPPERFDQKDLKTLLFPSESRVIPPPDTKLSGSQFMIETMDNMTTGLYINSQYMFGEAYTDGVTLVTPFSLGDRGYARRADGSQISRSYYGGEDYWSLYQTGHNSIVNPHEPQLHRILQHWTWMIEEGFWEVDEHGVKGGIEMWKEADTEEHGWKYRLEHGVW